MKTLLAVFLMSGSVIAGPVATIDISDASNPKDFENIKSDMDAESRAAWQKHIDDASKNTSTHTIVTGGGNAPAFGTYTSDNGTSGSYTIIGR